LHDQSLGERISQIENFRGQARRCWWVEAKRRLVAETLIPGATVHAVAQRHGVNNTSCSLGASGFALDSAFGPLSQRYR
jgi:hypothetical protein